MWHVTLRGLLHAKPDRGMSAFREAKEARQKQRDKEIALLLAG